jgi:formylglycine-generating enzyme required for sulfatase activity
MFYTGIPILEELQKKYPEQLCLYVLGTHEKFLVVDESYGFIGSHNFLTSDDSSTEREIGIHTNNLDVIKELLNNFNEASAKSIDFGNLDIIEELPNTFNEASVKPINFAVPKIIKSCQAVKRKKIIFPKIVETYTEKFTIEKSRPRGGIKEIELEMVILPAGSFLMGSDDFATQKPIHQVTLKQFAIAKYLVTQEQYQVIMETNPSRCKDNPKNPVDSITWNDAQIFCQKLSQKTGRNYRLPSESEWEYACRAGTQTPYYFGDNERRLDKYAWCQHNSDSKTHPVGEKKPNNWGLYDMSGNVWEWCEDGWHEDYQNAPQDGTAWNDNHSQTNRRVLRGGSSFVYARIIRSAFRCTYDFHDGYYGFRVALSLPYPVGT